MFDRKEPENKLSIFATKFNNLIEIFNEKISKA